MTLRRFLTKMPIRIYEAAHESLFDGLEAGKVMIVTDDPYAERVR